MDVSKVRFSELEIVPQGDQRVIRLKVRYGGVKLTLFSGTVNSGDLKAELDKVFAGDPSATLEVNEKLASNLGLVLS